MGFLWYGYISNGTENALLMWEHAKQSCEAIIRGAKGEYLGAGDATRKHPATACMRPVQPEWVTIAISSSPTVSGRLMMCGISIYVTQAFFLTAADKTTTLSILAFTMRTCDYMIENFRTGVHERA